MNFKAVEKAFTPVVTYGGHGSHDFQINSIVQKNDVITFNLRGARGITTFKTGLAGRYNVWNLTAGIILGLHLGIPEKTIQEAVERFNGVERRLNRINSIGNTLFLEDFAHHPTSIKEVLRSVRELYPRKRMIVLFEPRSWSLRRNFFQDRLADSFMDVDDLFFKEVFQKEKIAKADRLDVGKIQSELTSRGKSVTVFEDVRVVEEFLAALDMEKENVVIILSNGSFDGLPGFVGRLMK